MKLISFIFSVISSQVLFSQQAADTIRAGNLKTEYLAAGKQQYLVYISTKNGDKKNIWLWERATSREKWNGVEAIVIRQQWTTSDTGFNSRQILSVQRANDFSPLYHTTINPKTGRDAYNFHIAEIVTADTVADVTRKDFRISLEEPTFNWELDLETFSLLPLKEGRIFVLNFYHPGSKTAPAWYRYTVTGSEKIMTADGKAVDCFKLYTSYGNNRGDCTWWLAKNTHEVLKAEEHFGAITRYKLRILASE